MRGARLVGPGRRQEKPGARGKVRGRGLGQINRIPRHGRIGGARPGGRVGGGKPGLGAGGRGGAVATSEVDGGPGVRPVLRRAKDATLTMAAALAEIWAPPGPPEGVEA